MADPVGDFFVTDHTVIFHNYAAKLCRRMDYGVPDRSGFQQSSKDWTEYTAPSQFDFFRPSQLPFWALWPGCPSSAYTLSGK